MTQLKELTSLLVKPKIYVDQDHEINRAMIDPDALYVIRTLQEAGHTAYLVGGSVRDLLLQRTPKDFDISTSARPEEIKTLFKRRCLLIGRRFRLAHVRFGNKVIEVATFRTGNVAEDELITHDNEWGTAEDDVLRRDFTINGLFYDPSTESIIDYVGGWEDIHKRLLRVIGDPVKRFKQDPVRMLRLLKFRARIQFNIHSDAKEALIQCRKEITKSSQARLLEEMFRMLESGAANPFMHLMTESGLLSLIFPRLTRRIEGEYGKAIYQYLAVADKIHQHEGSHALSRPALAAALVFPILEKRLQTVAQEQDTPPHLGDISKFSTSLVKEMFLTAFPHFPRRITATVIFTLATQYRFTPFSGKKKHRPSLFRMKEFPPAIELLKMRAMMDESLMEEYEEWKGLQRRFMKAGGHEKTPHPAPRKSRGSRRRRHAPRR